MELRPHGRVLARQADPDGPLRAEVERSVVYNIGYQGRPLAAFVDALVEADVEVLVDVRAAAWSQRPAFRKTALSNALASAGIAYEHLKIAGNPFRPRPGEDLDWRECAKKYRAHLRANADVLEQVAASVSCRRAALFCFEAKRSQCHRGLLLAALRRRAVVEVIDL